MLVLARSCRRCIDIHASRSDPQSTFLVVSACARRPWNAPDLANALVLGQNKTLRVLRVSTALVGAVVERPLFDDSEVDPPSQEFQDDRVSSFMSMCVLVVRDCRVFARDPCVIIRMLGPVCQ